MKIEKIVIQDYKMFKDFEIDFLDSNDNPLDLIVIAGINGSGKTSLFEFAYEALSNTKDINGIINLDATTFIFDNKSFGKIEITENISTNLIKNFGIENLMKFKEPFKEKIHYVKAQEQKIDDIKKEIVKYIDNFIYEKELSAKEAYEKLKDFMNNIFNDMDMQISFKSLDKDKNIYFENRNGETISIDTLSTGEKELLSKVFYLYIFDIKDSIIMIDEPEISLHPSWQNRVVNIYKNFAKKNNNQIIIATHSPQIISSTPDESLRILVKENEKIKAYSKNAYGMKIDKALIEIMGVDEIRAVDVEKKYNLVKNKILANDTKSDEFKKDFEELEVMMKNDNIDLGLLKLELLRREKNASSN
jgi:predicted ATPase